MDVEADELVHFRLRHDEDRHLWVRFQLRLHVLERRRREQDRVGRAEPAARTRRGGQQLRHDEPALGDEQPLGLQPSRVRHPPVRATRSSWSEGMEVMRKELLILPLGLLHHRQLQRALAIEVERADVQRERRLHPLVDRLREQPREAQRPCSQALGRRAPGTGCAAPPPSRPATSSRRRRGGGRRRGPGTASARARPPARRPAPGPARWPASRRCPRSWNRACSRSSRSITTVFGTLAITDSAPSRSPPMVV